MGLNPLQIDVLKDLTLKQPEVRLRYFASVEAGIYINVLTKHGVESKAIATVNDRAAHLETWRLVDLPLMVSTQVGLIHIRRGQVWVDVTLRFGQMLEMHLFNGYIYHWHNLTWPPGVFDDMTASPGCLRSITGTDPDAGSNAVETVPGNTRWRLVSFVVSLTTSADAGDRVVHIVVDDGTNELARWVSPSAQVASKTYAYYSESGVGVEQSLRSNRVVLPLPPALLLFQGWRIRTATDGMFAADNYGAPQMLVEEWLED